MQTQVSTKVPSGNLSIFEESLEILFQIILVSRVLVLDNIGFIYSRLTELY